MPECEDPSFSLAAIFRRMCCKDQQASEWLFARDINPPTMITTKMLESSVTGLMATVTHDDDPTLPKKLGIVEDTNNNPVSGSSTASDSQTHGTTFFKKVRNTSTGTGTGTGNTATRSLSSSSKTTDQQQKQPQQQTALVQEVADDNEPETVAFVLHATHGNYAYLTVADTRIPFAFLETASDVMPGLRRMIVETTKDDTFVAVNFWKANGRSSMVIARYFHDMSKPAHKVFLLLAPYPASRFPVQADVMEVGWVSDKFLCQFCLLRGLDSCECPGVVAARSTPKIPPPEKRDPFTMWGWLYSNFEAGFQKHMIHLYNFQKRVRATAHTVYHINPTFTTPHDPLHRKGYQHYIEIIEPLYSNKVMGWRIGPPGEIQSTNVNINKNDSSKNAMQLAGWKKNNSMIAHQGKALARFSNMEVFINSNPPECLLDDVLLVEGDQEGEAKSTLSGLMTRSGEILGTENEYGFGSGMTPSDPIAPLRSSGGIITADSFSNLLGQVISSEEALVRTKMNPFGNQADLLPSATPIPASAPRTQMTMTPPMLEPKADLFMNMGSARSSILSPSSFQFADPEHLRSMQANGSSPLIVSPILDTTQVGADQKGSNTKTITKPSAKRSLSDGDDRDHEPECEHVHAPRKRSKKSHKKTHDDGNIEVHGPGGDDNPNDPHGAKDIEKEKEEAALAFLAEIDTMNLHHDTRCSCKLCGTEFTRKYDLKRHVKTSHLDYRNYQCTLCGRKFKRQQHLNVHHKLVHEKTSVMLSCQYCDKVLNSEQNYHRHLKAVHHINVDEKEEASGDVQAPDMDLESDDNET